MSPTINAARLSGVHVALATPIGADGEIDVEALARLAGRVIDGGVDGLCPTGSTGEGPRLTRSQRLAVLRCVRDCAGPERMIIPAVCALAPVEVRDEVAGLAEAGASGVLVAPPFYYPMAPGDQLAWYEAVAADSAVPLVLYNIPAMTGVSIAPDVVASLARHDRIVGIKDSSRDMEYLQRVARETSGTDFAVLTGTDTLLMAALQVGANGAIAASMNLVPRLARTVYDAFLRHDLPTATAAQHQLVDIVEACRVGMAPAGWKAALAWAGVCSAHMVPPFTELDTGSTAALSATLERLMPT